MTDTEACKKSLSHTGMVRERQKHTHTSINLDTQNTKADTETREQTLNHTSTVGERQKKTQSQSHKYTESEAQIHRVRGTKNTRQTKRNANSHSVIHIR